MKMTITTAKTKINRPGFSTNTPLVFYRFYFYERNSPTQRSIDFAVNSKRPKGIKSVFCSASYLHSVPIILNFFKIEIIEKNAK
jgi:hypothetical protein